MQQSPSPFAIPGHVDVVHVVGRRTVSCDRDLRIPHVEVLRAEELQLLVLLRRASYGRAGAAAAHRHLADDELRPERRRRVRVGRIHHARRRVRLAAALPALDRRVGVLRGRLPAHVPRPDVRLLPQAARTAVADRHGDLRRADGGRLLRLSAAVGQHVLLGRAGDRVAVRRHSCRSARI